MINYDFIDLEIFEVGAIVLESDLMERAKKQKHHYNTTLYDHVLSVTRRAVYLCDRYEKKQKYVDRETVILAALCHDLGMVGRHEKYSNNVESCFVHPKESARLAKELYPDLSPIALAAIERHMWPLSPVPPVCLEEAIVNRADKWASVADMAGYCKHRILHVLPI